VVNRKGEEAKDTRKSMNHIPATAVMLLMFAEKLVSAHQCKLEKG